ncbi:hypothetical protein [Massilia sp. PWRC2]|uniref:hypothetical protein n=1 Tax=Massilia sp. PWRC2 TaxID=2804626 RepID=UPI003CE78B99
MQLDPLYLPPPRLLAQRAMALALLDAILCPEVEYRYFSYDPAFAAGQHVAAMRNGEGDHWYLHLSGAGAIIKGHVHALPRADARAMALQAQRMVPGEFAALLHDATFMMDTVSFCYWQRLEDAVWCQLAHPDARQQHRYDGSQDYLSILLAPASCYYEYATDYFECEPPLASIEHLYAHAPLTAAIVRSLNPQMSLADALAAAARIGYPGLPRRPDSAGVPLAAIRINAACSGGAAA